MRRHRLIIAFVTLAVAATGCSPYGPGQSNEGPPAHLSFITLTSQAGKSYIAVSLRLSGDVAYPKARLTVRFPQGSLEGVEAPPEGTVVKRVWKESVTWEIQDPGGPSIIGPFVLRTTGPHVKPEWASFTWTGGEVRSFEAVQRFGGGASGYGVLRPTPTTSKILIGHETEITAYALGGGIEGEIHIIALKDPLDPPPPDAVVEEQVKVAAFSVTVEPDKPYLVGLEMPAPRPLPPLARLAVSKAPLEPSDAPFERAPFAGRVSADGSRLLVPIAGSGRYMAHIDTRRYRTAKTLLSFDVLASAPAIRTRLQGAANSSEPSMAPAFFALGNAPALEILAAEAPLSSAYATPAPLTDTAWTGPLLCSMEACIGSTYARPAVVCDPTYQNVGCLDTLPIAGVAGLTVGDAGKRSEICSSRLCFVPGKALQDNRGVEPAKSDPIVFAVVGDELLSYSGDAIA
jgi:hypothetical protein